MTQIIQRRAIFASPPVRTRSLHPRASALFPRYPRAFVVDTTDLAETHGQSDKRNPDADIFAGADEPNETDIA